MSEIDDAVISLYEASKRVGLRDRYRQDWTPFLRALCLRGGVEVREDDRGVPCCRSSDLHRIKVMVKNHFDRPLVNPRAARPRTHMTVEGQANADR